MYIRKRYVKASKNIEDKTKVTAADETFDDRLSDSISDLKDDFDFITQGLECLGRRGANATSEGLRIAENLKSGLQDILDQIAQSISGGEEQ